LRCQQVIYPSSHIAVDEGMAKFTNRSPDTVKVKAKPIPEGFKIWTISYDSYVDDWLWHNLKAGPEGTKKGGLEVSQPVPLVLTLLAPTFQVHTIGSLEKPTYCAWGLKSPGDCVQGERRKRKFGDEVVNDSRTSTRPAQVKTCCKEC
jgi:hypothetical protein